MAGPEPPVRRTRRCFCRCHVASSHGASLGHTEVDNSGAADAVPGSEGQEDHSLGGASTETPLPADDQLSALAGEVGALGGVVGGRDGGVVRCCGIAAAAEPAE